MLGTPQHPPNRLLRWPPNVAPEPPSDRALAGISHVSCCRNHPGPLRLVPRPRRQRNAALVEWKPVDRPPRVPSPRGTARGRLLLRRAPRTRSSLLTEVPRYVPHVGDWVGRQHGHRLSLPLIRIGHRGWPPAVTRNALRQGRQCHTRDSRNCRNVRARGLVSRPGRQQPPQMVVRHVLDRTSRADPGIRVRRIPASHASQARRLTRRRMAVLRLALQPGKHREHSPVVRA